MASSNDTVPEAAKAKSDMAKAEALSFMSGNTIVFCQEDTAFSTSLATAATVGITMCKSGYLSSGLCPALIRGL